MPRLCANLKWLFTELPFLERFDAAARAGFRAVEYASPYEFPARDLRSRLNACGLKQVLFNTPAGDAAEGGGSGLACVPGRQGKFRDGLKRALDYAGTLDCSLVHVMAGVEPADTSHETAAAVYATNLFWAAEAAAGWGEARVRAHQPTRRSWFLSAHARAGCLVIEAMGRDRFGLQFDIYHCQVAQGDVTRRMENLMPVIAHMQLADVPGRNEPGTGEIGWDYVSGDR